MKVLTVGEEDVSCPILGVLRVPEVLNQSFNRLKKQNGNVTTYRQWIPHRQTKSSHTGVEPCYLIWGRDQVDGLHAGQGFTPLGDVFYNWRVDTNSKKQYHQFDTANITFVSWSLASSLKECLLLLCCDHWYKCYICWDLIQWFNKADSARICF